MKYTQDRKDANSDEMGFKVLRLYEDTHYKIKLAALKDESKLLDFGDKLINLWNKEQEKLNK